MKGYHETASQVKVVTIFTVKKSYTIIKRERERERKRQSELLYLSNVHREEGRCESSAIYTSRILNCNRESLIKLCTTRQNCLCLWLTYYYPWSKANGEYKLGHKWQHFSSSLMEEEEAAKKQQQHHISRSSRTKQESLDASLSLFFTSELAPLNHSHGKWITWQ